MPSNKCNSTMERAMGLISSRFNVNLSRNVPLCTLYFSSSTDNTRCRFAKVRYSFPLALSCVSPIFSEATWIHCVQKFLHCCLFNAEKHVEHSYKQEYIIIKCTLATNEQNGQLNFQYIIGIKCPLVYLQV